ncbi:TonB-dependent receptor plug domain-containing protein [candidate division CSSED10-310 bacterium]|uniref:TonB-dependent receptor plug domain-containing protein n=1 Tax=candidate division CSSED10-310 bacterium TaxID=2855610 RepID=A0ABV6Z0E9_UNCC1
MFHHQSILKLSLFFLFIVFPFVVGAEDESDDEDPLLFDLGQIEVVGERDLFEPTATTRIRVEEFDRQLDESVHDAVQRVPGLILTVGDKNEPQILIRGFNQERILILYDGVPLSAPYYGDVDTSELPLENLAAIKVVRGNASVLYGPNALGGVVSLISSKPASEPNFRLLTIIDQEANYAARLSHGARVGAFYYQLSAGLRGSDGWHLSEDFEKTYNEDGTVLEDGAVREHSAYNQWSAGFKCGWEWDKREISFSASYADAMKEIPPTTNPELSIRYWDFPEWKKYTGILAGRSFITENVEIRANLFYHKYDNVLRNYKDSAYEELKWESTYDDYSTGLVTRLSWLPAENFIIRGSINGVLDNHRSKSDVEAPWEEYEAYTYSFLSEIEWQPVTLLTMQLGLGWEIYDFNTLNNVAVAAESISNRTENIEDLTASFALEISLNKNNKLTAAVAKKNRFPTMHQLFSNIEEVKPEEITTLNPEQAIEYAVGYSFELETEFVFGATGFYYDVEELIQRLHRDALYANIEEAAFRGFEIWSYYGKTHGFQGHLSYTYLKATNETTGVTHRELPYVPDHLLHLDLGYQFTFGTSLFVGFTQRSEVIEYDYDNNPIDIPAYSSWDLTLRHSFQIGLSVILQAQNLLDENYYQELGYELPGRNIKLAVQYKL